MTSALEKTRLSAMGSFTIPWHSIIGLRRALLNIGVAKAGSIAPTMMARREGYRGVVCGHSGA